MKTKEKEVTKSTVKIDNMNETITNLKKENKCLLVDKNKAVKDKLKLDKKLSDMKVPKSATIKSTNISTKTDNLEKVDDKTVEEVRVDKLSVGETIKEETKEIELEEKEECFIGPRLPRLMTEAEKEDFFKKIYAEFKLDLSA